MRTSARHTRHHGGGRSHADGRAERGKGGKSSNCTPIAGTRRARHDGGVSASHTKSTPKPSTNSYSFTALGSGVTPGPWTSPFSSPASMTELDFYAALVNHANMPPHWLLPIYRAAASRYHVPWQILAAINREETNYGTDLGTSSAGAVGWMQFEPATWREYGMAVNRHLKPITGIADPANPRDAIFAAARYLHESGGTHNVPRAVFAYNHAAWYVVQVLAIAEQINVHGLKWDSSAHRKVAVMRTTARMLDGMTYLWGGGHSNWIVSIGYDCSGFVSTVLHSVGFLRVPDTTQTLPFARGIKSGPGKWITIYDRTDAGISDDHVIMDIKGEWWESGGSGLDGGAAMVHRIHGTPSKAYLGSFNLVLHPWGL